MIYKAPTSITNQGAARNYNYYSVSHLVCIGKQHSIYEVFTAKVGKVAWKDKIVRSGSEVITGSFD